MNREKDTLERKKSINIIFTSCEEGGGQEAVKEVEPGPAEPGQRDLLDSVYGPVRELTAKENSFF